MHTEAKKYKWSQRSEDREINKALIDALLARKKCTLLTNSRFICDDFKDAELHKGKEKCCHCADYVNCPAYNHYINHEVIRNRRKIGIKK